MGDLSENGENLGKKIFFQNVNSLLSLYWLYCQKILWWVEASIGVMVTAKEVKLTN